MHRVHAGFTMAAEVHNGESGQLRDKLKKLSVKEMSSSPFAKSETTLFVSGVILPTEYYYRETLPETLVFATTYYGPLENHLHDMISSCKEELCDIFQHCHGFPNSKVVSDDNLAYYLQTNSHISAFSSRYNCITKQEVECEKKLRNEIETYIDRAQDLNALDQRTALQIKTLIQRHITTRRDDYEWSMKAANKTLLEFWLINKAPITLAISLLLIIRFLYRHRKYIPLSASLAVAAVGLLRATVSYITLQTYSTATRPDDDDVRRIAATQLRPVMNEMTAAGPLKKGRLRRWFYATALRVLSAFACHLIKVPTVSNIRWLVVNKRKRLLFMPNYANSTDFYVREFLNGSTPKGVNFMFTNAQNFPDAKQLYQGGISKDPEGYMNAVHTGQHVTDLWYAHEPHLTSDVINKNRKIRNGLFRDMNEEQAKEWLKLL